MFRSFGRLRATSAVRAPLSLAVRATTAVRAAPSAATATVVCRRPAAAAVNSSLMLGGVRHVTATAVGAPLRKKVTTVDLIKMKDKNKPISMCTAYTYPSALHVDTAGIDVLLVGDSLAMVEHGHDTTLPVTMDDMLLHAKAVARGASRALLVGDMPFGSYEESDKWAVHNGVRYMKEGGMDCVKLEGGGTQVGARVRALIGSGIAVMGHIGLTPQKISVLGGFRSQGRTADAALQLIEEALILQDAGCFAIVIECVPSPVARAVTEALSIPTIGIGSGPHTSGQVLVYHDLLGMLEHAHHAHVVPRFSKVYADLGQQIQNALELYRTEVENRVFPSEQYAPYKMNAEETKAFEDGLAARAAATAGKRLAPTPVANHTTAAKPKASSAASDDGVIPKLY